MGGDHGWRRLRLAEPVAELFRDPDAGSEHRVRPTVRGAIAVRLRAGTAPMPAGVGRAVAIGGRVAIDRAKSDAERATSTHARADADANADRRDAAPGAEPVGAAPMTQPVS